MELHYLGTSGPNETANYEPRIDGVKIGEVQLRHRAAKSEKLPEGFESNVYYEIDPAFQGKGYAKESLKLLLEEARKVPLSEIIIVARESNIASQKVIEANGGELLESKTDAEGIVHKKYRILL